MSFLYAQMEESTAVLCSLSIILFAGFVVTRLTKRLHLPNVTGYIIAGVLIGPCCFQMVPKGILEHMGFMSDIALAFIAFGVGIGSGILWSMIFQGRGFVENLGYIMSGFSIESGVEAVDSLVNRGGFSSMLSLVGILLVLGMLSGLFSESNVLTVLVNKLSRKLNTPGTILLGVWVSSLIICLIGGQYPAIAIPAVAFKDVCDDMDIHRCVLSRTLEDVGTMVAAIIPWSAWVIGYGVVLGGVTVGQFIPFTFLPMLCPIITMIHNFLGIGLFHKNDEVKYRPLWRRK